MIPKWEYCLLLLILPKVFKNAIMETCYFTKLLYLKKDDFFMQKVNQKISKEDKRQVRSLKVIRKK